MGNLTDFFGITTEVLSNEFITSNTLTAAASVEINYTDAQIFNLTPNQNTTLDIINPIVGIQKDIIITGAGGSYTIAFTVSGGSGTFNKISGDYDDAASTKNLISIACYSSTEFWYSISQIAV